MPDFTTDPFFDTLGGLVVIAAGGLVLVFSAGFGAFEIYELLHTHNLHH